MRRGGKRAKAEPESESDSEDPSSSSSSSSSAEEVVLDLDEDGRVRVEGLNVTPFRSFPNAIAEGTMHSRLPTPEMHAQMQPIYLR